MNRMLQHFQLKTEYQDIKPFKCEFREGLNVIVGENASGKSTMLKLMAGEKCDDIFSIKLADKSKNSFRFLDTETDNPKTKGSFNYSKNVHFQAMSHFTSHGETMLPLVKSCVEFKDTIIFIDEPEAGISLKNQKVVLRALKKAVKNGCQVIVTTHSYVIIKNVKEVFSLDKRKWITSQEYLKENVG